MIVVTTPTGQIGGRVLDALVDAQQPVRVVARDPGRLPVRAQQSVEVVVGSHDDPDVVAVAFDGADTVFWVVPPDPRAPGVGDHYLDFTRPASQALTAHGVRRVVAVSSLGRGWNEDAGQLSAAFAMDDLLERTGVGYRSLRMPYFRENLLHQVGAIAGDGVLEMLNDPGRPLPTVSTADVATAATRLLLDGSWDGQDHVDVVSPPDLSPNAMAQVMSEVLARPVRVEHVEPAAYVAQMTAYGMSDAWAEGLVAMAAAQDAGIYDVALGGPRADTTFERWCVDTLAPAVQQR